MKAFLLLTLGFRVGDKNLWITFYSSGYCLRTIVPVFLE